MKRTLFTTVFGLLFLLLFTTCRAQERETIVVINTSMCVIKVKLFNETPLHRANFIKLVEAHRYDSLLFHRVIKQFMIQAGDVNSKGAAADQELGDGDLDYTVPAEIVFPQYFNKRGMLCAARMGDDVNPERASSASQFYIVTGKHYTAMELDKMEKATGVTFTEAQRSAYMLEGGAPHLDGKYTVFGQVTKGMDVVDKIQVVPTNANDRPVKDVVIKTIRIEKK